MQIQQVATPYPSAVAGVTPTTMTSPAPAAYLQGTLSGVAGMLSMSTGDLRSALASGQSIADLAAQKSVGRDAIVNAIEQQVREQRAAQGQAPVDQQTLDQVVNRAIDRHRHRHHGHHHASAVQPAQQAPAQTLQPGAGGTIDVLA